MRRVLWFLAATAVPAAAAGQSPSQTAIDVQNFWPAAGPSSAVALRSSDVQPHLSLGFALVANFMYRPLVFRDRMQPTTTYNAVDYALTTDFLWSMGLFDRVQLAIALPIVAAQGGVGIAPITGGGTAAQLPGTALRDVRFDVGVALLARARRTDAAGFGLRLDLGGSLPTGDEKGYQGAASATFAPMVVADYRVAGLTVTANAGARVREAAAVASIGWASQAVLGLGLSYRSSRLDRLVAGVDYLALVPVHGAIEVRPSGATTPERLEGPVPMELYFGARYAVDRARDIEVVLGGGAPLTRAATVPAFRVLAGIAYTPRGLDNDRDGVTEADDECPALPEDRDGFQDQDGCPDEDNDGDRVVDVQDRCPNAPEDVDNHDDADGCPDPDNDNDGVPDAEDQCATESAGSRPDPERRGCPVRDRDGDAVLDAEDICPDEPQGASPDPTRRGCPIADQDRDAVADVQDRCPGDPQGPHPDRFRPGCPDPDRDHDGIANELDRCPDEPETINGATDDDGCSDAGEERVTWAGNVLIFQNVIRLRPRARALRPADAALLAQAAQRIRARGAEVEHVLVEVVPAPGAAGEAEATRLARLVADALVAHGVTRDAIDARAVAPAPPAAGAPRAPRTAAVPVGELRLRVLARASAMPAPPPPTTTSTPPVVSPDTTPAPAPR